MTMWTDWNEENFSESLSNAEVLPVNTYKIMLDFANKLNPEYCQNWWMLYRSVLNEIAKEIRSLIEVNIAYE